MQKFSKVLFKLFILDFFRFIDKMQVFFNLFNPSAAKSPF